jgi:hypothetical protein
MSIALSYDRKSRAGQKAFTRIDLLVLIIALVLALFIAPFRGFTKTKEDWRRISCLNNLRRIGIASREWGDQHGSNFIWQTSITNGGTREFTTISGDILTGFVAMANELRSPRLLLCPSETQRHAVDSFTALSSSNLSYFVGFDCPYVVPQAILAGDRNIEQTNLNSNPRILISTNTRVAWTANDLHKNAGNLLIADGSAEKANHQGLAKHVQAQFAASTNASITWLLP